MPAAPTMTPTASGASQARAGFGEGALDSTRSEAPAVPLGRPTKFTAELGQELCAYLREGQSIECSAGLARIATSTVYEWVRRGRAGEEPFAGFVVEYDRARAEAERVSVAIVRSARTAASGESVDDWRAHVQWLARARRGSWGDKAAVELTGTDGAALFAQMSTTELIAELRKYGIEAKMTAPFIGPDAAEVDAAVAVIAASVANDRAGAALRLRQLVTLIEDNDEAAPTGTAQS
jgi:hypothetical protein